MSVSQNAETGNILMYCWGCDSKGPAIVQALGLRTSDLFGDPGHPAAIASSKDSGAELSKEDLDSLGHYLTQTYDNLYLAEEYLLTRFDLLVSTGSLLKLGVDPGDNSIDRPDGFGQFGCNAAHLIIPFLDPTGKPVGMQGRRLVSGDPRWRSTRGSGWSQMGCIGWDLLDPVIITEGPSDALSVVGRAKLPALAIRGASLTSDKACEQIKLWLNGRKALVIGDAGEAGEKFAQEISEKVGVSKWQLPEGYGDLSDFLGDGGNLDSALMVASEASTVEPIETRPVAEIVRELVERIRQNLPGARYDVDLVKDLHSYHSQWENIQAGVISRARTGQVVDPDMNISIGVGDARTLMTGLERTVRSYRPPRDEGGEDDGDDPNHPRNRGPVDGPEIIWNPEDQLHVTEDSIKDAMDHYNRDEFYQAAPGQYVKVIGDDLVNLKEPGVKSMLSQMGHWRIINGVRETGHVPTEAARMVTDPSWHCDVDTIKRRVDVPFMLEDGSIVSTPGFHEASGIFLLPRRHDPIQVPDVPITVTDADVDKAKRIFEEVVDGFLFTNHASKSNLIAMTLTSPLRELFRINPMVPLLVSTAPQSGSGKGTSIRVPLSTAGVGPQSLSTTAYNSDENEFEKKLVGKLLKKSTYIFLDNIRSQVNSSVLEQMLTAAHYDGRTLGYSEVNSLSTLALWVSTLQSTGSFNRDLTRRCVPVELTLNWKGHWSHKNIESYLANMRGDLIWACFVVARKWLQDGGPISNARLDGYGGWTEVIGGILENVLGYKSFLDNLESFRKAQDEVAMTVDGVLERWLIANGEKELPARFIVEELDDPHLHKLIGLNNPTHHRQILNSLARLLNTQTGHIINRTHIWTPTGSKSYGNENPTWHFKCVPLPED